MPNQRDIVLVPIPFTDLTSKRRRPVVVVSNDEYNHQAADYSFTVIAADLAIGSLRKASRIRVDKICTLV
jgi:mRNA interferase MazF